MGTSSSRRDLDNHESSPSFYSPLWLMPPPRPNPSLRLMPPLMPGTHTTVMVIPDTMVSTADTTVLDGVDTMVDYGYPRYGYRYWKRDAEAEAEPKAEAEADPAVLYSSVYGHGLTYGYPYYGYRAYASPYYTYAHAPAVTYAAPVTYGAATVAAPYRYYANSAGVVHAVAKREADEPVGKGPNPEADADAWYGRYYGGYYGYPRYYGGYYGRRWGYGYGWGK